MYKVKVIPLVLILLLTTMYTGLAEGKRTWISSFDKLSFKDRQAILTGHFTVVRKTDQLPSYVRAALARACNQSKLDMADPNQPFNATDAIIHPAPSRRLRFAAVYDRYCVVQYEHGGFAYSVPVVLIKRAHGGGQVIGVFSSGPLKDYTALRHAMIDGKLNNKYDYVLLP